MGPFGCSALLLGATLAAASFEPVARTVKPLRIHGIVTAVFTPYHANGTLDLDAVPTQAAYQKKTGVKGVFVGGTTGDSLALSLAERKALIKAWAVSAKANGLIFIVHVGTEALGEAMELARLAEELGADAVGCMASVFFKPSTVEVLAQWLQHVGSAAPSLPLYYYHIPSMTGVKFMMLDLLKAVEKTGVPTFVGVKYTGLYETSAFPDFEQCTNYAGGRYEILCGREEMTLEAISVGAVGFIGSQFNFAGDLYVAISKALPNITRAREIQSLGLDLIDAWKQVPTGVNGNRLTMAHTSSPVGPDRLPSLQADAATKKAHSARIQAWCTKADRVLGFSLEMCKSAAPQPMIAV